MDEQFTDEQWKRAEVPALVAIAEASGSSWLVVNMVRQWEKEEALRAKGQAQGE